MRYFYDTEFLEDGNTIELISIGIVAEDGREFYAVNGNAPWDRVYRHDWLRANVVPSLPMREKPDGHYLVRDLDWADSSVLSDTEIRTGVQEFITGDRKDNELWAYYSAYDHVVLCQLFGRMIDLPDSIPMFSHDIKVEADRLGVYPLPIQDSGHHNALEDAKWNRDAWEYLAGMA